MVLEIEGHTLIAVQGCGFLMVKVAHEDDGVAVLSRIEGLLKGHIHSADTDGDGALEVLLHLDVVGQYLAEEFNVEGEFLVLRLLAVRPGGILCNGEASFLECVFKQRVYVAINGNV